ncbi:hypothetical protein V2E24_02895 [Mycoplasmopsis ciconiae]|uniref:ECM-binding protein homolog n=1 Tax=Mycoplasmopsis ciconiae TaxID=561067 RepID=A0ABU7MLV4_9BACT|nr:hypothetical protein [Mycoplasmopsis ciconiae]
MNKKLRNGLVVTAAVAATANIAMVPVLLTTKTANNSADLLKILQAYQREGEQYLNELRVPAETLEYQNLAKDTDEAKKASVNTPNLLDLVNNIKLSIEDVDRKYQSLTSEWSQNFTNSLIQAKQALNESIFLTIKQKNDANEKINDYEQAIKQEWDWKKYKNSSEDLDNLTQQINTYNKENENAKKEFDAFKEQIQAQIKQQLNDEEQQKVNNQITQTTKRILGADVVTPDTLVQLKNQISNILEDALYSSTKHLSAKQKYDLALSNLVDFINSLDQNHYPNFIVFANEELNKITTLITNKSREKALNDATLKLNTLLLDLTEHKAKIDVQRQNIDSLIEQITTYISSLSENLNKYKQLKNTELKQLDENNLFLLSYEQLVEKNKSIDNYFSSLKQETKELLEAQKQYENSKENLLDFYNSLTQNRNETKIIIANELDKNDAYTQEQQTKQAYLLAASNLDEILSLYKDIEDNNLQNRVILERVINKVKELKNKYPDNFTVQQDADNKIKEYTPFLESDNLEVIKSKANDLEEWRVNYENDLSQRLKALEFLNQQVQKLNSIISDNQSNYPTSTSQAAFQRDSFIETISEDSDINEINEAIEQINELIFNLDQKIKTLLNDKQLFETRKNQLKTWAEENISDLKELNSTLENKINSLTTKVKGTEEISVVAEAIKEINSLNEYILSVYLPIREYLEIKKNSLSNVQLLDDSNKIESIKQKINEIDQRLNKTDKNKQNYLDAKNEINVLLFDEAKNYYDKNLALADSLSTQHDDKTLKEFVLKIQNETPLLQLDSQSYFEQAKKLKIEIDTFNLRNTLKQLNQEIDRSQQYVNDINDPENVNSQIILQKANEISQKSSQLDRSQADFVSQINKLLDELKLTNQQQYTKAKESAIANFNSHISQTKIHDNSDESNKWNAFIDLSKDNLLREKEINNLLDISYSQIKNLVSEFNNKIANTKNEKQIFDSWLAEVNKLKNDNYLEIEPQFDNKLQNILNQLSNPAQANNYSNLVNSLRALRDEFKEKSRVRQDNIDLIAEANEYIRTNLNENSHKNIIDELNQQITNNTFSSNDQINSVLLKNQNISNAIERAKTQKRNSDNNVRDSQRAYVDLKAKSVKLAETMKKKGEAHAVYARSLDEIINSTARVAEKQNPSPSFAQVEESILTLQNKYNITQMLDKKQDLLNLISDFEQIYNANASVKFDNPQFNEAQNVLKDLLSSNKMPFENENQNPQNNQQRYEQRLVKVKSDFPNLYKNLQNRSFLVLSNKINELKYNNQQTQDNFVTKTFNSFVEAQLNQKVSELKQNTDNYQPSVNQIINSIAVLKNTFEPIKQQIDNYLNKDNLLRNKLKEDRINDNSSPYINIYTDKLTKINKSLTTPVTPQKAQALVDEVQKVINEYESTKSVRIRLNQAYDSLMSKINQYEKYQLAISSNGNNTSFVSEQYNQIKQTLTSARSGLNTAKTLENDSYQNTLSQLQTNIENVVSYYQKAQQLMRDKISNLINNSKIANNNADANQTKEINKYNQYIDSLLNHNFDSNDSSLNPLVKDMILRYNQLENVTIRDIRQLRDEFNKLITKAKETANSKLASNIYEADKRQIYSDIDNLYNSTFTNQALINSQSYTNAIVKAKELINKVYALKNERDLANVNSDYNSALSLVQTYLTNTLGNNPNYRTIKDQLNLVVQNSTTTKNQVGKNIDQIILLTQKLKQSLESSKSLKNSIDSQIQELKKPLLVTIKDAENFIKLYENVASIASEINAIKAAKNQADSVYQNVNSTPQQIEQAQSTLSGLFTINFDKAKPEIIKNEISKESNSFSENQKDFLFNGGDELEYLNKLQELLEKQNEPGVDIENIKRQIEESKKKLQQNTIKKQQLILNALNNDVLLQIDSSSKQASQSSQKLSDEYSALYAHPSFDAGIVRNVMTYYQNLLRQKMSEYREKYKNRLKVNPDDTVARLFLKSTETTLNYQNVLLQNFGTSTNHIQDWDKTSTTVFKKFRKRYYDSNFAYGYYGLYPKEVGKRILIVPKPDAILWEAHGIGDLLGINYNIDTADLYQGYYASEEGSKSSQAVLFFFVVDGFIPTILKSYEYTEKVVDIINSINEYTNEWMKKIDNENDKIQLLKTISYAKARFDKVINNITQNTFKSRYRYDKSRDPKRMGLILEAYYNDLKKEAADRVNSKYTADDRANKQYVENVIKQTQSFYEQIKTSSKSQREKNEDLYSTIITLEKSVDFVNKNFYHFNINGWQSRNDWKIIPDQLSDFSDPENIRDIIEIYKILVGINDKLKIPNNSKYSIQWLQNPQSPDNVANDYLTRGQRQYSKAVKINENGRDWNRDNDQKGTLYTYNEFKWNYKNKFKVARDRILEYAYVEKWNDKSLQNEALRKIQELDSLVNSQKPNYEAAFSQAKLFLERVNYKNF